MSRPRKIRIEVQAADALEFPADVLVLKYAQSLYGADLAVHQILWPPGDEPPRLPGVDRATLAETRGLIVPEKVLFVGVVPLRYFGYEQIREFGRRALVSLEGHAPAARHVALTIHGPGYGLDEVEAFESELAGVIDAIAAGEYPESLGRVSFVELNPGRAERLQEVLDELIPSGMIDRNSRPLDDLAEEPKDKLRTVGHASADKPHVFVAMPFMDAMDDVFHYGIQGAVKAAGFLCERADLSSFSGDVVEWVKSRIASAAFVVADLSTANPNVYLEVGYAWGCGRSTILLVRDGDDLKFDVQGQRCLVYRSIKQLEEILSQELKALAGAVRA